MSKRLLNEKDIKDLNRSGLNGNYIAEYKFALEFYDGVNSATAYVDKPLVEKVGLEYIRTHTTLYYSKVCEEWFADISLNDYYNDADRYPPMTIKVKFYDIKHDDGAEIYKALESGNLFIRLVSNRETFARWYRCNKYYSIESEIRANISFDNDGEIEKITYDDYNGAAAYKDTFNPNFNKNIED